MNETEFDEASSMDFEYMLRNERTFLEELLALDVGDDAKAKIERRLRDLAETIDG